MAAFVGHLDQQSQHRAHPQQGLQHQQHEQAANQVLAEGHGQRQQHLAGERSPQPPEPGQRFAQQQGGEHQGEQGQGQLAPELDHLRGKQGQRAVGRHDQAQRTGEQGLRQTPALHAQLAADQAPDDQQDHQVELC